MQKSEYPEGHCCLCGKKYQTYWKMGKYWDGKNKKACNECYHKFEMIYISQHGRLNCYHGQIMK
jgi:hypothetical protein